MFVFNSVSNVETIGQFLIRSTIGRTIVTIVTFYQSSADRWIRPIVVPMVT